MTVFDNTIQAEGLGDLFKNLSEKGFNLSKTWPKLSGKILHVLWTLQQTLLPQPQLEILKR